jgi:hypothetical protein
MNELLGPRPQAPGARTEPAQSRRVVSRVAANQQSIR